MGGEGTRSPQRCTGSLRPNPHPARCARHPLPEGEGSNASPHPHREMIKRVPLVIGRALLPSPTGRGVGGEGTRSLQRCTGSLRPNPHPARCARHPLPEGEGSNAARHPQREMIKRAPLVIGRALLPSPTGRGVGGEGARSLQRCIGSLRPNPRLARCARHPLPEGEGRKRRASPICDVRIPRALHHSIASGFQSRGRIACGATASRDHARACSITSP